MSAGGDSTDDAGRNGPGGSAPIDGSSSGAGGATNGGAASSSSGGRIANGGSPAGGAIAGGGSPAGGATASGGSAAGATASGGSSGSSGGATGVSVSEFPSKLASAACSALTQCLGAAAPTFFNGATCADGFGTTITEGPLSLLPAAVQKGTVKFDAAKVDACLTQVGGAGCSALTRRIAALCTGALTGTVSVGGACSIDAECASGAFCKTNDACPGTCTKATPANGACKRNDDCADGLICSSSNTCVAPGKPGAACGGLLDPACAPAYVCGSNHTCTLLSSSFSASAGETCDPNSHLYCTTDQTCALTAQNETTNVATWVCEARPSSTACHFSIPEQCPSGQFCQLGQDVDGTCTAAPENGQACMTRIPSDGTVPKNVCGPGATCGADAKCHALARNSEACKANTDCESGACKSAICVAAYCTP